VHRPDGMSAVHRPGAAVLYNEPEGVPIVNRRGAEAAEPAGGCRQGWVRGATGRLELRRWTHAPQRSVCTGTATFLALFVYALRSATEARSLTRSGNGPARGKGRGHCGPNDLFVGATARRGAGPEELTAGAARRHLQDDNAVSARDGMLGKGGFWEENNYHVCTI